MFVRDVMTPNPVTVTPDTTFAEAMNILRTRKIRRLPVVKGEKLVGIITEKDLLNASPSSATTLDVWEQTSLLHRLKIKEIMTENVLTVEPNTPVEEAAKIMADNKVGALPVLKDGKLVGIITETDIFKTFVNMLGVRERGVRCLFKIPNKAGELAKLTELIYELGGNILSVASYELKTGDYYIVVKISEIDMNRFEAELGNRVPEIELVDSRFV